MRGQRQVKNRRPRLLRPPRREKTRFRMSPYHLLIELPPTPKKHISRETSSVLEKLLENINQLLPVLIWNQVKSLCTLQRGTWRLENVQCNGFLVLLINVSIFFMCTELSPDCPFGLLGTETSTWHSGVEGLWKIQPTLTGHSWTNTLSELLGSPALRVWVPGTEP